MGGSAGLISLTLNDQASPGTRSRPVLQAGKLRPWRERPRSSLEPWAWRGSARQVREGMRPGGLRGTAQGPGHPSPSSCLQVGLKLRWGGSVPTRPPGEGFRCLTREQRPRPISLHKNCRPARPRWGQWSQVRLGLIGAASASGSGSHLRATLQTPGGGGAGGLPRHTGSLGNQGCGKKGPAKRPGTTGEGAGQRGACSDACPPWRRAPSTRAPW